MKFSPELFAIMKEAICVNSSASITDNGESGSKTEIAMLKLLSSLGHTDYEHVRKLYYSRYHKIFPFDSSRKMSSTVISTDEAG